VVIGRKDGSHAAASESCSFPNLGFELCRELGPGETVLMTPEGIEQLVPPGDEKQICSFLWVYYGYPASTYEGINVEMVRNRCGAVRARRAEVEAGMVAGIPDARTAHGSGYASEAGLPFRRPFVKYTPTWARSFMPQVQEIRDVVARMKLIPIPELVKGNRVLFCEDSIVRGTQLKDTVQQLFDAGAEEVHMRPACPPLLHSCKYLNFSRSKSELDLAARRAMREMDRGADSLEACARPKTPEHNAMVDGIRRRLGLTSLRYQELGDMVEAIGLPKCDLCTYCWDGTTSPLADAT
jgi:amidophosphoribosyltransferase